MVTSGGRQKFGVALAQTLRSMGLTQAELAEQLQTTQSAVSAWINGRSEPPPFTVFNLEQTLGLAPGALSRLLGYVPVEAAELGGTVRAAIRRDPMLAEHFKPMLLSLYGQLVRLGESATKNGPTTTTSGRRLRDEDQPRGARRRRSPG